MPLKHISSFGVELEGIFNYARNVNSFDGEGQRRGITNIGRHLHADGSVGGDFPTDHGSISDRGSYDEDDDAPYDNCGCGDSDCEECENYRRDRVEYYERRNSRAEAIFRCAEWSSPPIFPDRQTDWADCLREFWPDSVNDSCGLHLHLGLKTPRDYARLIDIGTNFSHSLVDMLRNAFQRDWRRWPECSYALRRLEGNNQYCELFSDPTYPTQQFLGGGSRYTAVNFTAFRRYGTVELRILPAIRHADRGLEMLQTVLDFSDNYLHTDARKLALIERKRIRVSAEVDMESLVTEVVI